MLTLSDPPPVPTVTSELDDEDEPPPPAAPSDPPSMAIGRPCLLAQHVGGGTVDVYAALCVDFDDASELANVIAWTPDGKAFFHRDIEPAPESDIGAWADSGPALGAWRWAHLPD